MIERSQMHLLARRVGLFYALAKNALRGRMAYKLDIFNRVMHQFLALFVQISLWRALLPSGTSDSGITEHDMITYVIVGMFVSAFATWRIDSRIGERFQEGNVALDFVRPIRFKHLMISEEVGDNTLAALITVIPVCLIGACFWGFQLPEHPVSVVLFLITLVGGLLVLLEFTYIMGLLMFWFTSGFYLDWIGGTLQMVFSGTLVPLWFYPPALRDICQLLPWQLSGFAPISLFLEKADSMPAAQILLLQAFWLVVLLAVEKILWRWAERKVEVYGG